MTRVVMLVNSHIHTDKYKVMDTRSPDIVAIHMQMAAYPVSIYSIYLDGTTSAALGDL